MSFNTTQERKDYNIERLKTYAVMISLILFVFSPLIEGLIFGFKEEEVKRIESVESNGIYSLKIYKVDGHDYITEGEGNLMHLETCTHKDCKLKD